MIYSVIRMAQPKKREAYITASRFADSKRDDIMTQHVVEEFESRVAGAVAKSRFR